MILKKIHYDWSFASESIVLILRKTDISPSQLLSAATKPALLAASQPHTQHRVNEGLHPEWVPYWLGGHWRVGIQALGYAFKIIGVLIGG